MKQKNRRHFIRTMLALPATVILSGRISPVLGYNGLKMEENTMESVPKSAYLPPYVSLQRSGELKARGEILHDMMRSCSLCPRECDTNRLRGLRGDCKANADLEISSSHPHFGEERELVGQNGSGTIFFTNCSLLCVFCINYDISHLGKGRTQSVRNLANMMLNLQRMGCHNINLVTPTHYIPHILLALDQASSRGLRLPLVYNTCGWEKIDILQFLDGVVDVYLADFKYGHGEAGNRYSAGASSYTQITQQALLEMQRQVGTATADVTTGLINRGLMIRHLVMPENVARTDLVVKWIAENLPKNTYVNIMSQYTPMFKAFDHPEISRRITHAEYRTAVEFARNTGLTNLRLQMQ